MSVLLVYMRCLEADASFGCLIVTELKPELIHSNEVRFVHVLYSTTRHPLVQSHRHR